MKNKIDTTQPTVLGAIDIGSNGARLLIKKFDPTAAIPAERIRKVMFVRVPLRLGKDVFTLGKISKEREYMMLHMMKAYKQLLMLYRVSVYRACATSAMRDAENGKKVLADIEKKTGIKLNIIRGDEEAALLCNNLVEKTGSNAGNFAYVDVGGGSTEISLLHDGVLAKSHSFNIGTLRLLGGQITSSEWKDLQNILGNFASKFDNIRVIGSGGNINKLYKLAHPSKDETSLSVEKLQALYDSLNKLTVEERIVNYNLKDDRADVIVPAAYIFLKVCSFLKCNTIIVPNISLADSIVDGLWRSLNEQSQS